MTNDSDIRVLLVDDDLSSVKLLRKSLGRSVLPFVIDHVTSLAAALAFLADRTADAVLLDLGLHGSDGLETLNRLQSAHEHLPIVVHTANNDDIMALDAMKAALRTS